ncbi:MAG: hypothetical protein IKP06_01525 [Elusimicrobiaceae bacterium]|jgi:hypothetical protein|nr:hypothetical protein [Elusimicrobiaceae bacterium]
MQKPSQEEIDNVLNECSEREELGESKYPGMTYEQGVKNAIEWLQGYGENPME